MNIANDSAGSFRRILHKKFTLAEGGRQLITTYDVLQRVCVVEFDAAMLSAC